MTSSQSVLPISETIDKFKNVSNKITGTTRVPIQDPENPTETESATLQAVVDKGLEGKSFEPANPNIQAHIADRSNPHVVTREQIGAAAQTHVSDLNNPHQVTFIQVGAAPASAGVPAGGQTGNILSKASDADHDLQWASSVLGDYFTFTPVDAATVANLSMFIDVADNKLKFKDASGVVSELMLGPYAPNLATYTDDNGYITGIDMLANTYAVPTISQDGHDLTPVPLASDQQVVAWNIFKIDEQVVATAGVDGFRVPLTMMSGYQVVDIMAGCSTVGTSDVQINILKNNTYITTVPLTLSNQLYVDTSLDPNVIIADPPVSILDRGDRLTYEILVSDPPNAPLGLDLSVILRA